MMRPVIVTVTALNLKYPINLLASLLVEFDSETNNLSAASTNYELQKTSVYRSSAFRKSGKIHIFDNEKF